MARKPLAWIRSTVIDGDGADGAIASSDREGPLLSPLPPSAHLARLLRLPVTLAGHLELGEVAWLNLRVWRPFYWELRGNVLVQYTVAGSSGGLFFGAASSSSSAAARGGDPVGVVHLGRVGNAHVTAGWLDGKGGRRELVLLAAQGSRDLRFRVAPNDVRGGHGGGVGGEGQQGEPALEGWRRAAAAHLFESGLQEQAAAQAQAAGRVADRGSVLASSGGDDVDFSLGDVFRAPGNGQGERASGGANPMTSTSGGGGGGGRGGGGSSRLAGRQGASSGGVELSTRSPSPAAPASSTTAPASLAAADYVAGACDAEAGDGGGGEAATLISPRLDTLLMAAGVKRAEGACCRSCCCCAGWSVGCGRGKCATYARRGLIFMAILSALMNTLQTNAEDKFPYSCNTTFKLVPGQPRPCILWSFSFVIPILFFVMQLSVCVCALREREF